MTQSDPAQRETLSHTHPSLRVIVERNADVYVAQCVDFDLAAHGHDVDSAISAFIRVYIKNILVAIELGVEPFSQTPAAPPEYVEAWKRAAIGHNEPVLQFRIPDFAVTARHKKISSQYFGQLEAAIVTDVKPTAA